MREARRFRNERVLRVRTRNLTGYLRLVPVDPMTQAKDWSPVFDNIVMSPDQVTTGIMDVQSNSGLTSRFDGTAYNTW
jgi:hypothetical protein